MLLLGIAEFRSQYWLQKDWELSKIALKLIISLKYSKQNPSASSYFITEVTILTPKISMAGE